MGKLNGVLSKYEKQEQRMDAHDKKMTLILEKLDELCQGSDQKESMESTDENRNIMVSSIDDINVETGSESERCISQSGKTINRKTGKSFGRAKAGTDERTGRKN